MSNNKEICHSKERNKPQLPTIIEITSFLALTGWVDIHYLPTNSSLRDEKISYKYLSNAVGIGLLVANDNTHTPHPACRRYGNILYKYLANAVGIGLLVANESPHTPHPACRRYASDISGNQELKKL